MRRLRPGLWLAVIAVTVQLAWYGMLGISYFRAPGVLEGADFVFYYATGRVAREHGLGSVYRLDLSAAAQAETTGLSPEAGEFFLPNHPPFLYPLAALLAGLPYRAAYLYFAGLLLLLAAAGLPVLAGALRRNGWPASAVWIALAGILLFEPLFVSILKGQDSVLLLLGGLLWLSGMLREDDRMAGLGLALTLIRPQVAVILALPFLFRRRGIWWWFAAGGLALGLYSLLLVGWQGALDYLHVLSLSAGGAGYGMSEAGMFNFTGLLVRLLPAADPAFVHTLGWGLLALALAVLCVLWRLAKSIRVRHVTLAVSLGLFAAPHLHYHDLALLSVPLLGVGLAAAAAGRLEVRRAAALTMAASLLLLFAELWDPLRSTLPYLLMLALPAIAWRLESRPRPA